MTIIQNINYKKKTEQMNQLASQKIASLKIGIRLI
jgi:hypothetical protein